jgi:hypothetical protein
VGQFCIGINKLDPLLPTDQDHVKTMMEFSLMA